MVTLAASTDTQTMTLCSLDDPIGTCQFIGGEFIVHADTVDQQSSITRRLLSRFRLHATLAFNKGQLLTKEDFFHNLPNYLRNITFHAMRPTRDVTAFLPDYLRDSTAVLYRPICASPGE